MRQNPQVTRNAYQRLYDMVLSHGVEEYIDNKKKLVRYKFFRDEAHGGKDAVFGLDVPLMRLMNVLKSAAQGYGTERASSSCTVRSARRSRRSRACSRRASRSTRGRAEGALYTYYWTCRATLSELAGGSEMFHSPMHEEPLRLIPREWRDDDDRRARARQRRLHASRSTATSTRRAASSSSELMRHYGGDFEKVMSHVRVQPPRALSEKDRIGIGTFQPKDEKNQDSTELTGDINYRKIAEFGSDSDPRAFNFDGEFNIANRGIIEFVEILKLDVAFLYDLLGATQEHKIKPKKFAQTDIDEVIIGHTNEAEYKKLLNNEFMEALRDRTVKVDIPYITKVAEEVKIYEKDFNDRARSASTSRRTRCTSPRCGPC